MHFYKKKLRLLRLRYDTFRKVIADRGVSWDENTNLMRGSYDEWRRIFRATPFARAYRSQGERQWWELKEIFGRDEVSASDNSADEDFEEGSNGQSGAHNKTNQRKGGTTVIDLTTTSENE
ncbi:UNVERIFIED_CONTAM: hypothetical protein Sindi_2497400 [Sesamum indicum]